ncbi:hypothetical protein B5S31_g2802 [[Candida] boidinii]|nr:hypothetical protein B5S31_g2802 [[Candida] boidinii]
MNLSNNSNNNNNGITRTLYQRLSESSHPIALLFYLGFRITPIVLYIIGLLFIKSFIFLFILIMLLLASDFWNVKNISGRLLVGLRWWNESNDLGQSIWVFETADPNRYINPIDSKVFWLFLYLTPVIWIFMAIIALLKFQFISLILVCIAIILTITNAMAFTKCDKFGKANDLTSGMFNGLTSSLIGRLNPFQ